MVASVEETYRRQIQDVRGEVAHIINRMVAADVVAMAVETRLEHLE